MIEPDHRNKDLLFAVSAMLDTCRQCLSDIAPYEGMEHDNNVDYQWIRQTLVDISDILFVKSGASNFPKEKLDDLVFIMERYIYRIDT